MSTKNRRGDDGGVLPVEFHVVAKEPLIRDQRLLALHEAESVACVPSDEHLPDGLQALPQRILPQKDVPGHRECHAGSAILSAPSRLDALGLSQRAFLRCVALRVDSRAGAGIEYTAPKVSVRQVGVRVVLARPHQTQAIAVDRQPGSPPRVRELGGKQIAEAGVLAKRIAHPPVIRHPTPRLVARKLGGQGAPQRTRRDEQAGPVERSRWGQAQVQRSPEHPCPPVQRPAHLPVSP